jgi:asparagine synthase (glutamine-hydrolysing)
VYFDRTRPVERDTLEAMCDTIMHRGPDADGYYLNGAVGLGSRRLSIIDVGGGRMPISNEDKNVWIVYNGELYNFVKLRERLQRAGHRFATNSDTETIVHLYEEEGDDFVRHLNGMFALAIWDDRKKRLVLARDHLGIKPLFYSQTPDRLLFGSEIKSLLPDGVDREIDPTALHDYLSLNYVPGPRTMFAGVKKLPPGHMLTYEAESGHIDIREYWDVPRDDADSSPRGGADLEADLLELLREIVRDQMISDVPLGAFLSGGIDSSLVVALMSEVSGRPVKTFSIGFQEESYSELPYARLVAERFGTDHHELVMQPQAHDVVTAMANYFDEPFADSSSAAVFAVSELAARHVKVALSGDGGDELFGGYYTYQADKLARIFRRLPRFLTGGLLTKLVHLLPTSDRKASLDFKLKRFVQGASLPPLPAHFAWKAFFSEEMKSELYRPTNGNGNGHWHRPRPSVQLLQEHFDRYASDDLLNRLLYVDTKVQLVDDMLTKVDRMSMGHSLEVRVPLLDLRLVEFMARLPSSWKIRRMTLKYLLKRVAARLLPKEILRRPKAGFTIPVAVWLKHDLRDMVSEYLSPRRLADQGLFRAEVVSAMLADHSSGRRDYSRNIWNLLMFSLWHERYAAGPVGGVSARPPGASNHELDVVQAI